MPRVLARSRKSRVAPLAGLVAALGAGLAMARAAAESEPRWAPVEAAIAQSGIEDITVIVGDTSGRLFTYSRGAVTEESQHQIASASKLLTSTMIMTLVRAGRLKLSDHPQAYLDWWTDDPKDPRSRVTLEHLLAFTSGFNDSPTMRSCINSRRHTTATCARELYAAGTKTEPGSTYHYGPAHLHIAAAMAEAAAGQPFPALMRRYVSDPLALSPATDFATPSRRNPRIAGGASSSVLDYERLLQSLLREKILTDLDAFAADRTTDVTFAYRPTAATASGRDWHYALGAWRECDDAPFSAACAEVAVISSPGAFGWTPWIDLKNGYYGLVAMEQRGFGARNVDDLAPSVASVELEQKLQPLIEAALADLRQSR